MRMLSKLALSVLALTLTTSAFAVQKDVTLSTDTTLNGQKLAAGDYKLDYQVHGNTAEVKFLRNKKTVASATGQVVEKPNSADYTAVVKSSNDASSSVIEVQPAREKFNIRFTSDSAGGGK